MKIGHVLMVVWGVLFATQIQAMEQPIILQCTDFKGGWDKDDRSLLVEPTATYDGSIITIYSEKTWEQVSIYVVDEAGNVQYEVTGISLSGSYTFSLADVPQGVYTLILRTEMGQYEGDFSL